MPDMKKFKNFHLYTVGGPSRPLPSKDDHKKAAILTLYRGELEQAKYRLVNANRIAINKTLDALGTENKVNRDTAVVSLLLELRLNLANYERQNEAIEDSLYRTAEKIEEAIETQFLA